MRIFEIFTFCLLLTAVIACGDGNSSNSTQTIEATATTPENANTPTVIANKSTPPASSEKTTGGAPDAGAPDAGQTRTLSTGQPDATPAKTSDKNQMPAEKLAYKGKEPPAPQSIISSIKKPAEQDAPPSAGTIVVKNPTPTTATTAKPTKPAKTRPSHSGWNTLLKQNVSSQGRVNYAGFKAQKVRLQNYLDELQNFPPKDDWTRNESLAYWINAYNAFTVKLIVDNYPLASITDLYGGKPWDVKWIEIGGKKYSLNNIENDIIRPRFKEPLIHFAVNCAAKSCPPLLNEAFLPNTLIRNFDKQVKIFVNSPRFNKIEEKDIHISKIFDWYKEDFGDIISFLNKYSATPIKSNAKITYLEYDWALNQ